MSEDTTRRCFKTAELRVDETDGKKRIIGLAVPYNSPSEELWGFREIFKPGAFKDSLAGKDDMFADIEHDRAKKIGRRSKGTLDFQEKRDGLYATIYPPDTVVGRDAIQEVRDGLLDAMSISFSNPEDSYKGKGPDIVREIHKATLHGVTLTSFPAYPQTAGTVAERTFTEYRTAIEADDRAEAEKKAAEERAKAESEAAAKAAEEARQARDAAQADIEAMRLRLDLEEASCP